MDSNWVGEVGQPKELGLLFTLKGITRRYKYHKYMHEFARLLWAAYDFDFIETNVVFMSRKP
jgi:hypothetical protein